MLAVDHGAGKTGFAACDALRITARALEPQRLDGDSDALVEATLALARERDARTVLVGLPLRASGDEGERAPAIRAFAARIAERAPQRAVVLYDESLTTKAAEERMRGDGVPPADRRRWRDSYAALILLEDWLADGGAGGERLAAGERAG